MDKIQPSSQVPYIGDFVRIVCAVSNKYMKPINATKDSEEDLLTARRTLDRINKTNELQQLVEENHLERHSAKWSNDDECQMLNEFPKLDDTMLRLLTLGTYQLKMSSSYIYRNMLVESVTSSCFKRMMVCCESDCRVGTYHPSPIWFGFSLILIMWRHCTANVEPELGLSDHAHMLQLLYGTSASLGNQFTWI